MADYKNYKRSTGPRPRPFGDRDSRPREMHEAKCDNCHQLCQVPFRPNGKKPVYCPNCFVKDEERGGTPERGFDRGGYMKPRFSPAPVREEGGHDMRDMRKLLETMNGTLGKLAAAIDTFNRTTALAHEVRKHVPTEEPVVEVKAKAEPKKASKKIGKKVAKKGS